jgi:hypothetical protein
MHLAILLVTLYPQRWRQRYEAEMLALLEQHHITLITLLDLLFGMITARLDPQYRRKSAYAAGISSREATCSFLAGCVGFVLLVQMAMLTIDQGMSLLLTGTTLESLQPFGTGEPAMNYLVGAYIWDNEPPLLPLLFFAVTALVVIASLWWAVRQRHPGVMAFAVSCFALPVAAVSRLLQQPPDVLFWLHGFNSPLGQLSIFVELEALMGVVFLSVVKGRRANATGRYGLLSLVVGVDLFLILVFVYLTQTDALVPQEVRAILPSGSLEIQLQLLGLAGNMLPFVALALVVLSVGGSDLSGRILPLVVSGATFVTAVMVICLLLFVVGVLSGWQWGGWLATPWFPAPGVPAPFNHLEVVGVGLLLSTCLAVSSLRSLVGNYIAATHAETASL